MRLGALFLAGAVSLLVATPATAAQLSKFKVGNWSGGAYTHTKTGKFSHCAASAKYRNGSVLVIAIYRELTWAFGIANDDWKLTVGQTYPATYRIDSDANLSGTATAVTAKQVKIPLPGDDSLFRRMRRGSLLTVTVDSKTVKFKLTSTNQMLPELFDCVREWKKRREYQ